MLMQCHPNGGLNQQFILETAGEDTYYLAPHHAPEMALEEPVGNGLVTQQNKIPESTRQVFRFEKQSNGTYRITSTANPAGGLTVKDASLSAGAEVWSETYTGTENQQSILGRSIRNHDFLRNLHCRWPKYQLRHRRPRRDCFQHL